MNPQTDRFTVRAVALGLLVIAVTVVAALTYLVAAVGLTADQRTQCITALVALGTAAAGAAAGLLASTKSNDPVPLPGAVEVMGTAGS